MYIFSVRETQFYTLNINYPDSIETYRVRLRGFSLAPKMQSTSFVPELQEKLSVPELLKGVLSAFCFLLVIDF